MAEVRGEDEPFSMAQEACDSFEVRPLADGRTEVRIVIPPQFADLWLVKLSELRGTVAEVRSPAEGTRHAEPGAAADGGA